MDSTGDEKAHGLRPGVRLGVDVGDVRIGVARCDPHALIATPVET
ncbi:MAG: Holliday junction resolvase RuvX, partial [Propionibacteriales bacterium]|nr:Holliday junction resolvase RuvX [Propionibacteriales bacterium]